MKIDGKPYRSIWCDADGAGVHVIDQRLLPHRFAIRRLDTLADAVDAIKRMTVRGAPLIGATAAYGLALAMREDPSNAHLEDAKARLAATRPTAINLRWALDRLSAQISTAPEIDRMALAYALASELSDEDVAINEAIGRAGAAVIADTWMRLGRSRPVSILTHCNAGWLATVDWGTALAPIYRAHDDGVAVHVFVDETRPRNQGASLTAWELKSHGVPHTLIVDNAGGHLMQQGLVDLCIVGTDRVTADAAVCNKIGTYLKALAARDNGVPFYVGLPSPTIDWATARGADVPIEDRGAREVTHITGLDPEGRLTEVLIAPEGTAARNPGFDVTPPHLVTGFFTERGHVPATPEALAATFRGRNMSGEADLRRRMLDVCRAMNATGLNSGTSGNLSVRLDAHRCLMTPSGMAYETMSPDDMAILDDRGRWSGPWRPSSEWRFHRDILGARPEVGAILHTHSRHATALACLEADIPAFHYMIAVAGGDTIRCAPYRTFGTQELSEVALAALEDRKACLLGHHGMIVLEKTPERALALASEVEHLCAIYLLAREAGPVRILDAAEMARNLDLFRTYGTPQFPDSELVRIADAGQGQ